MFATATIVFREFLEIALVITIILAATQGLKGRQWLIVAGLGVGVAGSLAIAFFTDVISEAIDGVGLEVFNATVMFIAVGFLSWTVVWMRRHGREMAYSLKHVGQDVVHGRRSLYAISGVVALATLREGAEIVLFTYGMGAAGQVSTSSIVLGGLLGAAGGTVVGAMLYVGLLKAAKKHLFTVTSWMLILLTAGMAAQGANFLIAADILPALTPQLWDTSEIIAGGSLLGQTLGVLVGYTPRPSGMEVVFYACVMLLVGMMYRMAGRRPSPAMQTA